MGAEVRYSNLTNAVQWKSFVIIVVGIVARFVTTFICCFSELRSSLRLDAREKLFMALAWCAKAGGQGTAANSSMSYLSKYGASDPALMGHLKEISATALLSIVVFQPLSALWISNAAPYLLPKAELRRLEALEQSKRINEEKE